MAGNERVMDALTRLRKAGDPALLAERGELLHAAGQNFMDVALVSHVEDQPVPAGIKDPVKCDSRLYNAEIGGQMAARPADVLHKELADLVTQRRQLLLRQRQQILPGMDCL